MSDEEKAGERNPTPGNVVRNVIERIGDTLDVTAKTARLRLDIGALKTRRVSMLQEMGRKVYELYGKGLVKNAALATQCADVAQLDAQIAEKEAHIAELRGQPGHPAPAEGEETGIEEEEAGESAPPTSAEDLSEEEEREVRPPRKKKL